MMFFYAFPYFKRYQWLTGSLSLLIAQSAPVLAATSQFGAVSSTRVLTIKPTSESTSSTSSSDIEFSFGFRHQDTEIRGHKNASTELSTSPPNRVTESSVSSSDVLEGTTLPHLTQTASSNVAQNTDTDDDQVTSVSQLRDIQPTDWAFTALQSVVERYGCLAGYPDGTYRGNRTLTRYEFAAGLNACLNHISKLIAAGTADVVRKEDLSMLQKLQEQFVSELATLRGRVDALEARTTELKAQQFSTTTKLAGQVIFTVNAGGFRGNRIIDARGVEVTKQQPNATIPYRASLDFNTSFSGKDLLKL